MEMECINGLMEQFTMDTLKMIWDINKVWWFSLMERQLSSFGKMELKQPNYIVKRNKFIDVLEIHLAKFHKKIKIKNLEQIITNK